MKSTDYTIGDIVWVLTTMRGGTYKLPAAGVLSKIDDEEEPFTVLVGLVECRVKYVYDRDQCFDTALIALRTAENTLRLLGSICRQTDGQGAVDVIQAEGIVISKHIKWLEASRRIMAKDEKASSDQKVKPVPPPKPAPTRGQILTEGAKPEVEKNKKR